MRDIISDEVASRGVVPSQVEGLPTTGAMGKVPALTVGGIVGATSLVVTALGTIFGLAPPPEVLQFADEHGFALAGWLVTGVSLGQAAWTYFKVFSPRSVGEIKAGVRRV